MLSEREKLIIKKCLEISSLFQKRYLALTKKRWGDREKLGVDLKREIENLSVITGEFDFKKFIKKLLLRIGGLLR